MLKSSQKLFIKLNITHFSDLDIDMETIFMQSCDFIQTKCGELEAVGCVV